MLDEINFFLEKSSEPLTAQEIVQSISFPEYIKDGNNKIIVDLKNESKEIKMNNLFIKDFFLNKFISGNKFKIVGDCLFLNLLQIKGKEKNKILVKFEGFSNLTIKGSLRNEGYHKINGAKFFKQSKKNTIYIGVNEKFYISLNFQALLINGI